MKLDDAILASLLPASAILLEWKYPVEPSVSEREASDTIVRFGLVPPGARYDQYRESLKLLLSGLMLGAISFANLLLTGVALATGAVALAYELKETWWILVLPPSLAPVLVWFLLLRPPTRTLVAIATDYIGPDDSIVASLLPLLLPARIAGPIGRFLVAMTAERSTIRERISRFVYGANALLIAMCGLTYWITVGQFLIVPDLSEPLQAATTMRTGLAERTAPPPVLASCDEPSSADR
jgi:hypothetical protein